MQTSHLKALKHKHERLEREIHREMKHPAFDDLRVETMKKERLYIKEMIQREEARS